MKALKLAEFYPLDDNILSGPVVEVVLPVSGILANSRLKFARMLGVASTVVAGCMAEERPR